MGSHGGAGGGARRERAAARRRRRRARRRRWRARRRRRWPRRRRQALGRHRRCDPYLRQRLRRPPCRVRRGSRAVRGVDARCLRAAEDFRFAGGGDERVRRSGRDQRRRRPEGDARRRLPELIPPVGAEARYRFLAAWAKSHAIKPEGDAKAVVAAGDDGWTLPIPLVKTAQGWQFDTRAGAEEMRVRRIGRNELAVMQTMLAIYDAQKEYARQDHNGDGVLQYAARFASSPGKQDGLYWPTEGGRGAEPARAGRGGRARSGRQLRSGLLRLPVQAAHRAGQARARRRVRLRRAGHGCSADSPSWPGRSSTATPA